MIKIMNLDDLRHLPPIDRILFDAIKAETSILEKEYSKMRTEDSDGGYIILAENESDVVYVRDTVLFSASSPELARKISGTSYVYALYLRNNDFGVSVYLPGESSTILLSRKDFANEN